MSQVKMEEARQQKVRKSPLAMFSDAAMRVEKVRVAAQVRLRHLQRLGKTCPDTEELLKRSKDLEGWVDGRLAEHLRGHPAYWWFSHVKGCGGEVIAKIIGRTEDFGRYYDIDDPEIPPEARARNPEQYIALDKDGNEVVKTGIWVEAIERLQTPAKYRVLSGHWPGAEKKRGERLSYDAELKMLYWRGGRSLLLARGKFYQFYLDYKDYLARREEGKGIRIVPTPRVRYCYNCNKEVVKKAAKFCPDCGEPLSLKKEPPGYLYEGHLHHMAQRRMQQIFGDLLLVAWRQSIGLPVRDPYPIEFLGHSKVIRPEDMMDKSCGRRGCPICHGREL